MFYYRGTLFPTWRVRYLRGAALSAPARSSMSSMCVVGVRVQNILVIYSPSHIPPYRWFTVVRHSTTGVVDKGPQIRGLWGLQFPHRILSAKCRLVPERMVPLPRIFFHLPPEHVTRTRPSPCWSHCPDLNLKHNIFPRTKRAARESIGRRQPFANLSLWSSIFHCINLSGSLWELGLMVGYHFEIRIWFNQELCWSVTGILWLGT